MIGDLFNLGGSLVGAGLNYYGAKRANEMNQRISREQMSFQRASNREQMAFQERMSNTAYQRAMNDMQAAGLNPILAFNQGGASTPSGSSSAGSMTQVQNEFAPAINSAIRARMVNANVEQAKAMADIMKAELVGKQVEADVWKSKAGKALKVLQMVSPSVNSGANLFRLFK